MAVFGLGIMPYITSSIIMQLLTVVIPKLQQWQDQGEAGTKKINQWTRYLTVVLALLQSTGLVFLFHNKSQSGIDVFPGTLFTPANIALVILTFTAGTAMLAAVNSRNVRSRSATCCGTGRPSRSIAAAPGRPSGSASTG